MGSELAQGTMEIRKLTVPEREISVKVQVKTCIDGQEIITRMFQ
jgi:hypothetical protein